MSDVHAVARDQLRSFIERIERLEEEKKTIADDIKDVKAEAKGCGFDVGIINAVLKLRKIDANERAERDAMLDTYLIALGMLPEPAGEDEDYDRETGEVTIIDRDDEDGNQIRVTVDPWIADILGRQSAVPLRSDAGLSILTKHEDIRTSVGSQAVLSSLTTREAEESVVSNSPETAAECAAPEKDAAAGERSVEADGGAALVRTLPSKTAEQAGGKHEVATDNDIPAVVPTYVTGEGAANTALPAKPKVSFRPNCQHPENCASGTRDHCWSCRRAMQKSEEAA